MTNIDKILHDAALHLDLIARLIDNGAPLDSVLGQLRGINVTLDDVLVSELTDRQEEDLPRLYAACRALEKAAYFARRHGHYSYFWEDHPKYGWVIVKFA